MLNLGIKFLVQIEERGSKFCKKNLQFVRTKKRAQVEIPTDLVDFDTFVDKFAKEDKYAEESSEELGEEDRNELLVTEEVIRKNQIYTYFLIAFFNKENSNVV